ncbi:micronuclear linker histone polyprotein-like [Prorops nasuta]|uniref:micronuclear linker histone polyprotein-like n=1 Tax=Prorops nasuta TaxID=863751 RepID=UPI0034CE1970
MSEESSDSNLTCIDKNRKLTPKPKRGVTFESDSDRSGFRRRDLDERSSEPPNRTPANPEYSRERNAPVGAGHSALGAVPPELLASIVQLVIAYQSAGAQGSAPIERAPEMPQSREISRDSPGTSRGATSRRRQPSEYRSRNRSSSSERSSESSSRYSSRRATRVIDAFRKWGIRFKNHDADDAEDFIENLEHCRNVSDLTFSEIRETLPVVLSGEAKAWFKVEGSSCSTWRDFREAFLSQFGDEEDNDAKWEKARQQTQREGESIKAYLVRIRSILKEIRPTPSVSVQLDLVYRNLRPNYRRRMFRRDFDSFTGLREIGREIEKNAEIDKAFKPPPGATKTREEDKSNATGKNAKKSDEEKPKKKKSRSRRGKRGKSKRRSSGSTSDSSSGSDSPRESPKKSSRRSSRRHSDKGSRKESSSHSGHRSSSSDELVAIAAAPRQGQ